MTASEVTAAMAAAARELAGRVDPQETYETAVALARREIDGCDAAALTVVHRGRKLHSPAFTSAEAGRADELQYALGQGPCISATWEHRVVHSPDLATDARWRVWGPRAADELGMGSLMAFRLFTDQHTLGALNLYSRRRDGFDEADRDHGLALAAHVAVATRSAQQIHGLTSALASRTIIGGALGIIMERFDTTHDRAFAMLARLSSTQNVRLQIVAERIVETREIPVPAEE